MGSANEEKGAIPPWSVARAVLGDLVEVLGGNRDNVGIGMARNLAEVGPRTLPMTRHAEAYYLDAEPPKLTGLPDPDPMRALYGARGVR